MSYGRMQNPHVTMINELPDLEDLEGVGDYHVQMDRHIMERPSLQDDKYQKNIRGTHRLNPQAGMENVPGPMEGYGSAQPNSFHATLHPQEMANHNPIPKMQEMAMPMQYPNNHMSISCVDIAKHIQDCPICSKFYHNDKTVYIIAIVVLSIVCLLLLKRVLNV